MSKEYTAQSIKVLKELEAVRKRPGMYIGSTGEAGIHHMVFEILDNSIDEHMSGFCTEIKVTIHEDNSVEVEDNGRGIPVEIHPTEKRSTLEVVMTKLHAGGKFDTNVYKVSGGLHGVGASVVNALSEVFEVWDYRDGKIYYQKFQKGKPVTKVEVIGESEKTGLKVKFRPDPEIFEEVEIKSVIIERRLRALAYLNKGLKIEFIDKKRKKHEIFKYNDGIVGFVKYIVKERENRSVIHPSVIKIEEMLPNPKGSNFPEIIVEIAMVYTKEDGNAIYSYVNNIETADGGEHVTGFKNALTRTINEYLKKNPKLVKEKNPNFTGEDVRDGLVAVLSVKMPEPVFEGQTKARLASKEASKAVSAVLSNKLPVFFDSHPEDTKIIFQRISEAMRARKEAKRAREKVRRKSPFENTTLPGKLADCVSTDKEKTELFIVEGDSAGGNAKQARDRNFQAILPIRGKILNVEKHDERKLLKNEQVMNIVSAIGAGFGDRFDKSKLRYGKIIVMTDADIDGAHIRTLLLTLFYRYMRELIEDGRIYIAQPPLYRFEVDRKVFYLYSDKELEEIKRKFEGKKFKIQRYKGLGEMNPDQLWETTMDPEKRKLIKITVEDLEISNAILETLMGNDSAPRREFIEEHALKVKELDV